MPVKNNRRKAATKTITVKVEKNDNMPIEVLATAIRDVANAYKQIEQGPLRRETLVLLLNDMTNVPRLHIRKILDAAPLLQQTYCKTI